MSPNVARRTAGNRTVISSVADPRSPRSFRAGPAYGSDTQDDDDGRAVIRSGNLTDLAVDDGLDSDRGSGGQRHGHDGERHPFEGGEPSVVASACLGPSV